MFSCATVNDSQNCSKNKQQEVCEAQVFSMLFIFFVMRAAFPLGDEKTSLKFNIKFNNTFFTLIN